MVSIKNCSYAWGAYTTESLNLGNVFLEHFRLCPVVMSVELGNVVYLNIIPDPISETT